MISETGRGNPGVLTSPARLQKIDALREKNFGRHLPLPQLVVVGDQSSGKSSLLESLTGIPFPRGQELCTRYATQITSRRDADVRIEISIIPGPQASGSEKKQLEEYHQRVTSTQELRDKFPAILTEVNKRMKIRAGPSLDDSSTGTKTFTEDILKIEICGPKEDYLTVIDVPGIFRLLTEGVTTEKDRKLVESMVKDYIKDSRTIILAVLPSNVDIATQEILALAEEYDKSGERTLGVLTKPDLVSERSAQSALCSLINGKKRPLTLGYYIVRNRGGDDDDDTEQSSREDMFQEAPWKDLPQDRVGVKALKGRLSELLCQITDREFPIMRREARQLLATAQKDLKALGPSRKTEREQQVYLCGIASRFQAMVRAALDADYSHDAPAFDKHKELRLITEVARLTENFGKTIAQRGHAREFATIASDDNSSVPHDEGPDVEKIDAEDYDAGGFEFDEVGVDDKPENSASDSFKCPDLEDIMTWDRVSELPKGNIMVWVKDLYFRSRGMNLGTFGTGILSSAFREQSRRWEAITTSYVCDIMVAIHCFIQATLSVLCPETRVKEGILSVILTDLRKRYIAGLEQSKFLVNVEQNRRPYTLNHYFNTNLQRCRGDRIMKSVQGSVWEVNLINDLTKPCIYVDALKSATTNKSNSDQMIEEIHDILKSYYKVSRKRFVDNVYSQAVDHYLLSGPDSPLGVFCESWVLGLDAEQLATIAGESLGVRSRRESLAHKIQDLEATLKILN